MAPPKVQSKRSKPHKVAPSKPNKSSSSAPTSSKTAPSKETKDVLTAPIDPSISDEEDSDSEDDGIDEEGYKRLIDVLGEDGLNDFDKANLEVIFGGSETSEDEDEGEDESGSEDEAVGPLDDESEDDEEDEDEDEDASEEEKDQSMDVEEEAEDIPLDSLENAVLDEDVVPRQKVEIDNKIALERIREDIALDSSLPWTETLAITYPNTIEADVNDDLARELAFYNQALHSAREARTLASQSNPPLPWTRPADYFAEMVKSDSHMERIRQRLLDEKASIKRTEDMKKQREGKKFGKQVQMEKLKERQKSKKDMEERLRGLKRKRKDMLSGGNDNDGGDDFDVAVEDALSDKPRPAKKAKMPRAARDKKFGFGGGAGRRSKQNTKSSTDDFNPRQASGKPRKGGGKAGGAMKRPGKNRRMAQRSRR